MAENPATWNDDIKRIYDVICQTDADIERGICGASLPKRIYDEVVAPLRAQLEEFRDANEKLHRAYLQIRAKLGAWDTPRGPTVKQVYQHTEECLDKLLEKVKDGKST